MIQVADQVRDKAETGLFSPHSREMKLRRHDLEEAQIGALLIALLAFPAIAEAGQRELVATAMFAEWVQQAAETLDHASRAQWRRNYSYCLTMSDREIRGRKRTLNRRLRDRMIAARMGMAFFSEPQTGELPPLPASMGGRTIAELAKLVLSDTAESDPDNIMKRTWPQSRAVLHLAVAYRLASTVLPRRDGQSFGVPLSDPDLNDWIVTCAEMHRGLIYSEPRFKAQPGALWSIRLEG